MAVYCLIVHTWSFGIGALGPDVTRLTGEAEGLGVAGRVLDWVIGWAGAWTLPYHLVSAGLIFASMILLYLAVNRIARGPSWVGVFAANVWMAHPGHREATVALTGLVDLLPCVVALLAIVLHLAHEAHPSRARLALFVTGLVVGVAAFPINQWLGAVTLLLCVFATRNPAGRPGRLLASALAIVVGALFHPLPAFETVAITERLGALYFSFYGIGFLPETAERFATAPWVGWIAAVTVLLILTAIHWKARRPALLFALGAMAVYRLAGTVAPVDPVHLVGGGSLVFPTALLVIGASVLYTRTMEHKRWAPVLGLTSVTASVIFFLLMITTIQGWREAARLAEDYRAEVVRLHETTGEPVFVVPNFQATRGAPIQLSTLLSHDTPFTKRVPHEAAVPLDYYAPPGATYSLESSAGGRITAVRISGSDAHAALRLWEFPNLSSSAVDGGYRLPLPPETAGSLQRWMSFGEVRAEYPEPGGD